MRELHILCTFGSNPIGLRRRRGELGGVTVSSNIKGIRIAAVILYYRIVRNSNRTLIKTALLIVTAFVNIS